MPVALSRFFCRLFDRVPVRCLTSGLHCRTLQKKAYKVRGFDFEMQFLFNDQQRKFLKRNKSFKHKRKVEGRGKGKGRGLLRSRVRFPAGAFAIFFPFLPKLHFQFPFLCLSSTFRLRLRLTFRIYTNEQEFELNLVFCSRRCTSRCLHHQAGPIVSSNGCPTERISAFVDTILKPLVTNVPSFIRDTKHLLR